MFLQNLFIVRSTANKQTMEEKSNAYDFPSKTVSVANGNFSTK